MVPAIAVADALRASGRAEVSFLGTRERAEAELVPAAGYEIDFLRVSGLDRRNPLRAAAAAGRAATAVRAARRVLRARGARAVLGGGGYVAGPAGLAAVTMGLPLVLTEADSHLGLANRLLASRARRVCLAFPIGGREGDPYLVTGRPVPRAVLEADRGAARRRFGVPEGEPCVAVVGGSLGARSINLAAADAFGAAEGWEGGRPWVVHVAGRRDYAELRARLGAEEAERSGSDGGSVLLEYEPSLGDVLAAADLVVSRAGGSVMEIAAAERPAILVPYPHATGDHQTTNASWMQEGGAATVIPDAELDGARLRREAAALLADGPRLERMARASAALARPDAAERIAAEVFAAAEAGPR
ncbi:MAG: UDP-N-acetylglucosamine--N-acetylmuramyl-(pentapeptide) pyrophosphoryl-undecaprenol N-acetylglucosamine transferase [Solirubrobacterales bacterium]